MLERLYNTALIHHVIEICLQLFKGKFYYCKDADYPAVVTKADCLHQGFTWENKEYNFDNLAKVTIYFVLFLIYSFYVWFLETSQRFFRYKVSYVALSTGKLASDSVLI